MRYLVLNKKRVIFSDDPLDYTKINYANLTLTAFSPFFPISMS